MSKRLPNVLCVLSLAACAPAPFASSHIGPPAAIEGAIREYYRGHATEEAGQCLRPYIDGITAVEVVEDQPEELVVRVRYFFRDELVDQSNTVGPASGCTGFGERTFVVVDTPAGPRAVEMTGPRDEPVLRTLLRRGLERLEGGG